MENKISTGSLFTLAIIAVAVVLKFASAVFVPFIFSLFIYYSVLPLVDWIERKFKLPNSVSSVLSLVVVGVVITLLVMGSMMSLKGFISGADLYKEKFLLFGQSSVDFLTDRGVPLDRNQILGYIAKFPILGFIKKMGGSLTSVVGDSLLVGIFLLFLLMGTKRTEEEGVLKKIGRGISKYTTNKIFISILTSLLSYALMAIVRLDLALMFAILTFMLNFIPNVGSLFAVLITVPVVFLQFGIGWQPVVLLPGLLIIQFLVGNVLEPKLMGDDLGLHPITILLALILWGMIWGIPGMFLAVPLTAALKIVCEEFEYTRHISKMMSGELGALP